MKKNYSSPELELTRFNLVDVLSASYPVEDPLVTEGGDELNPEYTQPRN